ncbi:MAG: PilN domain-containing protein [Candidatus Rifleibacteriota bacterium]
MKHYLNFKPSIVFRKGSNFMLKTSLMILYGLPLVLLFFWSYNYFTSKSLNTFHKKSFKHLEDKNDKFYEKIKKIKPDKEELVTKESSYLDYRRVSEALKHSTTLIFSSLEKVTPGSIMFSRIRIIPEKLVKVAIEGNAESLKDLTTFVKILFKNKMFLNPRLKQHQRVGLNNPEVTFKLEVDYLGEGGTLP